MAPFSYRFVFVLQFLINTLEGESPKFLKGNPQTKFGTETPDVKGSKTSEKLCIFKLPMSFCNPGKGGI